MRVVVVGLGTAGAAVAARCARRGLQVVGLERGPLEEGGACWINGVPAWAFDEAGIPRPRPPELRGGSVLFHLRPGWDLRGVTVSSVLEVDMAHLSQRLRADALVHGAELRGGVRVLGRTEQGVETDAGRVEADVVVDASGYAGARLLDQPRLERADLCAAAQQVHHLVDRPAAEAFFRMHGAAPGEAVCFTGVAGGYSICNVRFQRDEVSLLTGTLPALGHPAGQAVLDAFVRAHPWIGDRVSGGARAIPLRRAWEAVGWGAVALVGDAGCQVFAAHGSGIAQELLAAELLARTLAEGGTPWDYNVAWQRRFGGLLAASDRFRRLSQTLRVEDIAALMRAGVLSPPLMEDTLLQRPVRPPWSGLLRAGRGLLGHPRLGRILLPVLVSMRRLERHYTRYPADPLELPAWTRQLQRLDPRPGPVLSPIRS